MKSDGISGNYSVIREYWRVCRGWQRVDVDLIYCIILELYLLSKYVSRIDIFLENEVTVETGNNHGFSI